MLKLHFFDRFSRRVCLGVLLVPLCLAILASTTCGQGGGPGPADDEADPVRNYEQLSVDTSQKSKQSEIGRMLREGIPGGQAQQDFDDFFEKYALARWTVQKDIPKLLDYRKELRNHFRLAKNRQSSEHLNSLVLAFLTKLAEGNYHPAVRMNAILAIGDLNGVEPSAGDAAVPLPAALGTLIGAVNSENLPDYLRAAAMVGILRHAEAKINDAEARRTLTAAMLQVLSTDIPAGPTGPGRQWILGQAIETLGLLGSPGENSTVAKALFKVLANKNLSYSTRTIAADALGHMKFTDAAGLNAAAAATAVARFAADACVEEQRLSKETGLPVSRRRMKQRIEAAATAATALKPLASADQKAAFAELEKNLKDGSAQFDAQGDHDSAVQGLGQKLEGWLKKQPQ